jgi:hypothetical protein
MLASLIGESTNIFDEGIAISISTSLTPIGQRITPCPSGQHWLLESRIIHRDECGV